MEEKRKKKELKQPGDIYNQSLRTVLGGGEKRRNSRRVRLGGILNARNEKLYELQKRARQQRNFGKGCKSQGRGRKREMSGEKEGFAS